MNKVNRRWLQLKSVKGVKLQNVKLEQGEYAAYFSFVQIYMSV